MKSINLIQVSDDELELFNYIFKFISVKKYNPAKYELYKGMEFSKPRTDYAFKQLIKKGLITWDSKKPRSITIPTIVYSLPNVEVSL